MLTGFGYLTKKAKKSILLASIWHAIFQIACMLPMILIIVAFEEMRKKLFAGNVNSSLLVICLGVGIVIIFVIYFCYQKMYQLKYLSAADENLHLRMTIMDKIRRLPESYLAKRDLSDLTSAVMDDVGTIEGILANQLTEMIGGFLAIGVTLLAMFFVNLKMALVLSAVIPFVILSMSLSDTVSGKTHLRNRNKRIAISDAIQEYLENVKVLKITGNIQEYQKGISKKMRALIPGLILFELLAGMCVSMAYNLLRMGIGIVAIYGGSLLLRGEIGITTYVTFLLMAVWIYEPLSYTCEHLGAVIASKVAATRLGNILEQEEQTGEKSISPNGYDVCFENVDFSYSEEKGKVLKNISFTAKQGEYTALVGASGSGKSTVCRLAARLWDANGGKITVGGVNIQNVAPEELLQFFSIVFQDVTLFNDTIYNNILIGNKNATREQVLEAARNAECMSFIDKFPEGIDTVIGENGHTLSGGERQRLSIARAFLKNAPIILLDESTASIDPETETKIQAAIERLTRGKTVLMIAHRLRSIVGCDRIIVMEDGGIVGNGTHEELMETCEAYQRLYSLQTEGEG